MLFYWKFKSPALFVVVSIAAVPLGGLEEDQCVILGLGGHDSLHKQQLALAAWGAQRLWFLCLFGGASGVRP